MTTYKTDKTSRIILSIIVAYTAGYGIARAKTLQLASRYERGTNQQFITPKNGAPGDSWAYKVFFPAIKLEEIVRSIPGYF
ncbi:MAG: hypothetical protein AAFN12_17590 [Cyanobacteria bacterium J06560_2]